MHTELYSGNLKERIDVNKCGLRWEDNIKVNHNKWNVRGVVWTELAQESWFF
jgi:hypothetical protein